MADEITTDETPCMTVLNKNVLNKMKHIIKALINDQSYCRLMLGVRFFDIRIVMSVYHPGELWTAHGNGKVLGVGLGVDMAYSFADVMRDVDKFLNETSHESEVVLIKLQKERSNDQDDRFSATVQTALTPYQSR